ncbi:MAG: hypothetical protein DMG05_25950 [Acidobacteria bacterium]|nr:MAG: hypothetical protein DMG05_25950 [Acidobacteriota bacterium]
MGDFKGEERRNKPRLYESFPIKVRGINRSGLPFETDTLIENLSASGLYMSLREDVTQGSNLFVVIKFSTVKPGPRVAASGVVLRVEPKPNDYSGVAVAIRRCRFLDPN